MSVSNNQIVSAESLIRKTAKENTVRKFTVVTHLPMPETSTKTVKPIFCFSCGAREVEISNAACESCVTKIQNIQKFYVPIKPSTALLVMFGVGIGLILVFSFLVKNGGN